MTAHYHVPHCSDSLQKHIELRYGAEAIEKSSSKHFSENNHRSKSAFSEMTVKYGVSPAKAAQVERQSSTDSDVSSLSSEEEQPSVERSRPLVRSASPRRSASPMRRVQIGRSGSRRSTAITIKSLNYYPARDKMFDVEAEQTSKRPENNVRRMSVQDAINLFESKQKDQTVDNQKVRSSSLGPTKSVLRRWSSGMGEDSSQCPQDTSTEIQNNEESREVVYSSSESEAGPDVKLDSSEKEACSSVVMQEEIHPTESTESAERLVASAEWSRQKEAELNELLKKMMQTKPVKSQTVVPPSTKRQSLPSEQRGGFYDHYKEKRDEKLRGEASRKKAEKEKQFKTMQLVPDAKKSQNTSDAGKKSNVKKLQKPQNSASIPANPKAESPRLGVVKRASPKASSLPSTRKSLPSMPLARGPSPAKTPASPAGATPTRRKSQPTPPVSQPSPRVEMSQIRAKTVKPKENDSKKIQKQATEKKQQSVMKPRKTTKSKVQTAPEDLVSSAKPSKTTKKSSVVPVESKPFLRKGSKTTSSVNPAVKKKVSHPQEKSISSSAEDQTLADENPTAVNSSDLMVQQEETKTGELEIHMGPQQSEDKEESVSVVNPTIDDSTSYRVEESESKVEAEEESTISPTAWVEIEEHEDHSVTDPSCPMVESPIYKAPVKVSSPRVRHSLSQMLLEESSEPDVIDWGNAENPPAMVYQKDAPKGFKRLLKFARKSKTDANATGWSSPPVFSEGEDDAEDSKFLSKRSSENLLRIATHHSMNNEHQKSSTDHEQPGTSLMLSKCTLIVVKKSWTYDLSTVQF